MPGPISDLAARMWDGTELPIDPLRATVSRPPVAADGLMGPMNEHVDDQTAYEHFIQVNDARTTMVFVMANVYTIETPDGLVMIDGGTPAQAPLALKAIRRYTKLPLHTAIYTHGHLDHVWGPEQFEAEPGRDPSKRITVIAHENVPLRFKRYDLTNGYNAHINSIQTQRKTPWPSNFRHPDVTYRDSLTISVGGVRLDLFHARGETDDGTWVYYPDGNAIFTGDLFLWVSPNCGNPQKQQRYPLEWSLALRKMQSLRAEFLFPGHGPPILGAANVNRALDETARFLELILDHTLQGLNAGHRLDAIIGSLSLPTDLLSRPYLRPIYDEPEFVVRNIWRLYGGWYDQNPSNLKPPREGKLAVSIAKLAGSPIALARTAEKEEDTAVAVTLIENAWLAAKELRVEGEEWKEINRIRSGLYLKQAGESTSLMAQSIYKFASGESLREVGV